MRSSRCSPGCVGSDYKKAAVTVLSLRPTPPPRCRPNRGELEALLGSKVPGGSVELAGAARQLRVQRGIQAGAEGILE